MSNNPLLSLITVTLNNLNGLEKTSQSITPQTCKNYEWIIIDGGSTDGTKAFLDTTNSNWTSETDNGIYDAMNKGIKRANGQYILFLNAGDALENKNTLYEIHERIKDQPYDFLYGDSVERKDANLFFKRSRPHFKITEGMFTHHQAMLYRAKLLKNIKYDLRYKLAADYDLTWRAVKEAKNLLYLPFPICIFESGGVSQRNVFIGRLEQFKIRKSYAVSFLKNSYIFLVQTLSYALRRAFPKIYWFLKR